ncbi:MAG TPA: hypothetical protein VGK67_39650 [Myxococcales bacterium]
MDLHSLASAVEGELVLKAEVRACFSETDLTVRIRWNATDGEVEAEVPLPSRRRVVSEIQRRRRRLSPGDARELVRKIVEAAEREEMKLQDTSTTSHILKLEWRSEDASKSVRGESTFATRSAFFGSEGERIAREMMARGGLPEKAKAMVEEGLAKGFYIRAMALTELAEEIFASIPPE